MRELAQGKQDFKKIIEQNLIYVDKTEEIYKIVNSSLEYIFFSRPRRFGKSMLISTLKHLFQGNKELFKGLYIYDKYDFETFPVIHIDFSFLVAGSSPGILRNNLEVFLNSEAKKHNLETLGNSLTSNFSHLIKQISEKTGKRVVILVDEYDKAITDNLTNIPIANENREVLKELFSGMKNADQYLRMLFMTGVSKFAKLSVFSTLNNMTDISLMPKFHNLVGFKFEEIEHYFKDYLELLAEEYDLTKEDLMQEIQKMYNGYSWDGKQKLYNPYSLTNSLYYQELGNYWFQSATPTFLIKLIKERQIFVPDLDKLNSALTFSNEDLANLDLTSLLFQTGYLTIKKVERAKEIGLGKMYHLSFPNEEVKISLFNHLLADKANLFNNEVMPKYIQMKKSLNAEDMKSFLNLLKSTFSKIPAKLHLKAEAYYHSLFYMLLYLLGAKIKLEEEQALGTVDAILETEKLIYIVEFKFSKEGKMESLLNKALNQIKKKKYFEPYLSDNKKILLLGAGFLGKEEIDLKLEILA